MCTCIANFLLRGLEEHYIRNDFLDVAAHFTDLEKMDA